MTEPKEKEPFVLNRGETKPFKTLEEQLDILISRGLIVDDRENAIEILKRTNYYRFSAYSLTLRKDDRFDAYGDVHFDDIYELYRFDDALRNIILKYSLYIEVAFRAYIAYEHSRVYGAQGYMDPKNFSDPLYHIDFIAKLTEDVERAKEDVFVYHHNKDKNSVFPFWVAVECASFGLISKLFKNLKADDRNTISKQHIGVSREYVENWLQATVYARNVAAHGGRFYNRKLRTVRINLPNNLKKIIDRESPFAYIYAIHKLQPTKDLSKSFREQLKELFIVYPFATPRFLGFPENWFSILEESENKKAYSYK